MAELKTKPNSQSVAKFLNSIKDPVRRRECKTLARLMKDVTGEKARMWGPSIVGYGSYHYRYPSGREGDWFLAGFSPRKTALTVYVMSGLGGNGDLMKKLGKHKTGKSCLYLKSLDDADPAVLRKLIERSVESMRKAYPAK